MSVSGSQVSRVQPPHPHPHPTWQSQKELNGYVGRTTPHSMQHRMTQWKEEPVLRGISPFSLLPQQLVWVLSPQAQTGLGRPVAHLSRGPSPPQKNPKQQQNKPRAKWEQQSPWIQPASGTGHGQHPVSGNRHRRTSSPWSRKRGRWRRQCNTADVMCARCVGPLLQP